MTMIVAAWAGRATVAVAAWAGCPVAITAASPVATVSTVAGRGVPTAKYLPRGLSMWSPLSWLRHRRVRLIMRQIRPITPITGRLASGSR
jgi:hypothetical protein